MEDAARSTNYERKKLMKLAKVQPDQHVSSHDIAKGLNINHYTVLHHLKKTCPKKRLQCLGAKKKLPDRIFIHATIQKSYEIRPFLLSSGDEEWITYDNNAAYNLYSSDALCCGRKESCSVHCCSPTNRFISTSTVNN